MEELTLVILFAAAFYYQVSAARVCYPGQEPSPIPGSLQWSVNERDLRECSEYRVGGLNTRAHPKPYGVIIGNDQHLQTPDNEALATASPASACATLTNNQYYPSTGYFNSLTSERLDFTIRTTEKAYFGFYGMSDKYLHVIAFYTPEYKIRLWNFVASTNVGSPNGIFRQGERIWVAYTDTNELQVGKHGHVEPLLRLANTMPSAAAWRYHFYIWYGEAILDFYTPCYD